tara:strand:- start:48 stop:971 length:924 start_codon:yes stop_codon:yes gene_type:complete
MTDNIHPDTTNISAQQAAAMLQFYAQSGVVDLLDDAPIDRYAATLELIEAKKAAKTAGVSSLIEANRQKVHGSTPNSQQAGAQNRSQGQNKPAPTAPQFTSMAVPDQAAMDNAKALAKSASNLEELKQIVSTYKGCNLCHSAKHTVFADGNVDAPIMIIGDAPARDEDLQGIPFSGPMGQLMDKMLAAIGLDRDSTYLSNIIPWRPPGNRTPVAHELELCRPFIERHIELAAPKILVTMGSVSTACLLRNSKSILSVRGTWVDYQMGEQMIPLMPSLNPAYLLKTPAAKCSAWSDLLAISAKLKELG